jgi:hypothetical protein
LYGGGGKPELAYQMLPVSERLSPKNTMSPTLAARAGAIAAVATRATSAEAMSLRVNMESPGGLLESSASGRQNPCLGQQQIEREAFSFEPEDVAAQTL